MIWKGTPLLFSYPFAYWDEERQIVWLWGVEPDEIIHKLREILKGIKLDDVRAVMYHPNHDSKTHVMYRGNDIIRLFYDGYVEPEPNSPKKTLRDLIAEAEEIGL